MLLSPRGVTDVHVYTPERVAARYGIAPRLDPRLPRPQGRPLRRHPGHRRASATRPPPTCCCASARWTASYANLPAVPGEKRRESLADAEADARRSRELATIERDLAARHRHRAACWPRRPIARASRRPSGASSSARRCAASTSSRRRCRRRRSCAPASPWPGASVDADGLRGVPRRRRGSSASPPTPGAAWRWRATARSRSARSIRTRWRSCSRAARVVGPRLQVRRAASSPRPALAPAFDTRARRLPARPGPRRTTRSATCSRRARRAAGRGRRSDVALVRAAAGPLRLRAPTGRPARGPRARRAAARAIELPLVEVLASMELAGIAVDAARMGELAAPRVGAGARSSRSAPRSSPAGRSRSARPSSSARCSSSGSASPAGRKGKTGYSTDAKVLARIRDAAPDRARGRGVARALEAALDTYLLPFPELLGDDGRLRTTFSQTTASTGRLSAQRPNLQNIPIRTPLGREIRATFVARRGLAAAVGRLLAGRAAHPCAPLGRGAAARRVRARRRHPRARPPPRCSASRPRA